MYDNIPKIKEQPPVDAPLINADPEGFGIIELDSDMEDAITEEDIITEEEEERS